MIGSAVSGHPVAAPPSAATNFASLRPIRLHPIPPTGQQRTQSSHGGQDLRHARELCVHVLDRGCEAEAEAHPVAAVVGMNVGAAGSLSRIAAVAG